MIRPWRAIKSVWRSLSLAKRRPRVHREIVIIGHDNDAIHSLIRRLFECERDGARVLIPDLADPATTAVAPALTALYLRSGGGPRRRRWVVHVPEGRDAPPDDGEVSWERRADTMVLCLSRAALRAASSDRGEEDLPLLRAVSFARDRGRLSRSSVVVLDPPETAGPRDALQVRCDLPRNRSLAEGVSALLTEADGRPGDGLADPLWREFLSREVGASRRLARLVETARLAVGRQSPLFFVPCEAPGAAPLTPLLEWLDGRVERRGASRALYLLARALTCGAAVTAIAFLIAAAAVPPARTLDRPAWRGLSGQSLVNAVNGDLALRRSKYSAVVRWALDNKTAENQLNGVDRAIENYQESQGRAASEDARARRVDEATRLVADALKALGSATPSERLEILGKLLDDVGSLRKQAGSVHSADGHGPAGASASLGTQLMRAGLLAAIGSVVANPADPSLMVSDPGIGRRALDMLRQEGADASLVGGVGTLLATPDAVAVHRGFDRLAAEHPMLREFRGLLPRVDARAAVAALVGLDDATLLRDAESVRSEARALLALQGDAALDQATQDALRDLLGRINELSLERPMVIRFTRPFEKGWHLDISCDGGQSYRPARWFSGQDGCVAEVWAGYGRRLHVAVNWRTDVHAVVVRRSEAPTMPCVEETRTSIVLRDRQGSLTIDGREINYEVISGWPATTPGA